MPVICSFCEKDEATHFSDEWDANLCDECEAEQNKLIEEAPSWSEMKKEFGL